MLTDQMSLAAEFDAWYGSDPRLSADPYPFFHHLQAEAPFFRRDGVIVLSRYAECSTAAMSRDLWKTDGTTFDYGWVDPMALPPTQQQRLRELVEMELRALNKTEGEQHDRLRKLVQRAFTPRAIESLQGRMQEVCDMLLDRVGATGRMEAIADFAFQLPLIIICDMLDVPTEDRHQIRAWSIGITGLIAGERNDVPAVVDTSYDSRMALLSYIQGIIDRRRSGGARPSSVISTLLQAEADDRLSDEELVANAALFVLAGHETTTNGIGNAIVALMTHRDQWNLLRDDPRLAENATAEALRYISPVQTEPRYAIRDVQLSGEPIYQGDRLRLLFGAANRDPDRFNDPDRFDITRSDNKHLAFGAGHHYCLGGTLAKQEISVALRTLVRRFPDMRMIDDQPTRRTGFTLRGPVELPLRLGPERG